MGMCGSLFIVYLREATQARKIGIAQLRRGNEGQLTVIISLSCVKACRGILAWTRSRHMIKSMNHNLLFSLSQLLLFNFI
jgi:hypothetical protein